MELSLCRDKLESMYASGVMETVYIDEDSSASLSFVDTMIEYYIFAFFIYFKSAVIAYKIIFISRDLLSNT